MEKSQQEKEQLVASFREMIEAKLGQTTSGFGLIVSDDDGRAVAFCDFRSFNAVRGVLEGIGQIAKAIASAVEDGSEPAEV